MQLRSFYSTACLRFLVGWFGGGGVGQGLSFLMFSLLAVCSGFQFLLAQVSVMRRYCFSLLLFPSLILHFFGCHAVIDSFVFLFPC